MRMCGWHGADHPYIPKPPPLSNLQKAAKYVDGMTSTERERLIAYIVAKDSII